MQQQQNLKGERKRIEEYLLTLNNQLNYINAYNTAAINHSQYVLDLQEQKLQGIMEDYDGLFQQLQMQKQLQEQKLQLLQPKLDQERKKLRSREKDMKNLKILGKLSKAIDGNNDVGLEELMGGGDDENENNAPDNDAQNAQMNDIIDDLINQKVNMIVQNRMPYNPYNQLQQYPPFPYGGGPPQNMMSMPYAQQGYNPFLMAGNNSFQQQQQQQYLNDILQKQQQQLQMKEMEYQQQNSQIMQSIAQQNNMIENLVSKMNDGRAQKAIQNEQSEYAVNKRYLEEKLNFLENEKRMQGKNRFFGRLGNKLDENDVQNYVEKYVDRGVRQMQEKIDRQQAIYGDLGINSHHYGQMPPMQQQFPQQFFGPFPQQNFFNTQ